MGRRFRELQIQKSREGFFFLNWTFIIHFKAIGMKIIDSGPRPRGGRVAASKFHYLGQMSKKFIILKILPIFKNFVNFFFR